MMSISCAKIIRRLVLICIFVSAVCAAQAGKIVYETDFDALEPGLTQHHPGDPDQDNWYLGGAGPGGYGQIQPDIARGTYALEQLAAIEAGSGSQTINRRELTPPDLSVYPKVTLQADFYAHTSDPNTRNSYTASLRVLGGPHPGYEICAFSLNSGNGNVKIEERINLGISAFNGMDNHYGIPLTVGRNLEWNQWHQVKLVIDQQADRYVSLTVNDQTQDIGSHPLPRSYFEGQWLRGELIESLHAEIVPTDNFDDQTDDYVFWDNISIEVDCPQPLKTDWNQDCKVNMLDMAMLAAEWLSGS